MGAGDALSLGRRGDDDALMRAYRARRRVRVPGFLGDAAAARLHADLAASPDWRLVLNSGDKVFEIDRPGQRSIAPDAAARLETAVTHAARDGFQYRYETIRVPDDPQASPPPPLFLAAFARFLNTPPVLAWFGQVTGVADIAYVDAQATCYGPGHFLTAHDDDVAGKGRRAAYVLGLTPRWRPEWGGLLLFHDTAEQGEAYFPAFNSLALFAVPQPHSVSMVTPSAADPRYSITGWLRAKA